MSKQFLIALLTAAVVPCVTPVIARAEGAATAPSFDAAAARAEEGRLRAQLAEATSGFEKFLAELPESERGDWQISLQWDAWSPAARAGDTADLATMRRVVKHLFAAENRTERPHIVALRAAMIDALNYAEATAAARGDLSAKLQECLATLRADSRESANYAALEDAAWWLAVMRQAPDELAACRERFAGPAIVGQIHRELVEPKLRAFEAESEEERATRRRVQGAVVVGKSQISSRTKAELADTGADARVRITTIGRITSPQTIAQSDDVRVTSSGATKFTGVAEVYWDGGRFLASQPRVTAATQSRVKSIQAPPLKRGLANRKLHDGRRAAAEEVRSLVERDAAATMTTRLAAPVERINAKAQGFLNLLARTGNTPRAWVTHVHDNRVEIGYVPATVAGVTSPPGAVPPLPGDEMIGLSFHDSGLEAILGAQVAGAPWSDAQFATLQRELTGGNNTELLIGLDPQRWSAQWSWRRPVRIHFTSGEAEVRYRFDSVAIDGETFAEPVEARAKLRVDVTPLGMKFVVLGPVVVATDGEQRMPPHFQAFFERKFGSLFGDMFYLDGLQFPAGGHLDPLSTFRPVAARAEPGWMHLRYSNRPPRQEVASAERAGDVADAVAGGGGR